VFASVFICCFFFRICFTFLPALQTLLVVRLLFTSISRTFQDQSDFPGLSRSGNFNEKNSRTFQDFPGGVGTLHSQQWLCRVPTQVLESPAVFFIKIPGPGKSWKITLVLESPGNWSLSPGKSWKNILENYTSLKSPASLALSLVSWFSAK